MVRFVTKKNQSKNQTKRIRLVKNSQSENVTNEQSGDERHNEHARHSQGCRALCQHAHSVDIHLFVRLRTVYCAQRNMAAGRQAQSVAGLCHL